MKAIVAPPEMQLVLDNDIFTHLRNKKPYVIERIKEYFRWTKTFPAIPTVTLFEAMFGLQNGLVKGTYKEADLHDRRSRINELIQQSGKILPFNETAAEIAAYVFARLSQSEKNKHWRDLFITATAISHGFGLATKNERDAELIASKLPDGVFLRLALWKE